MELKFTSLCTQTVQLISFNRTFMELKYMTKINYALSLIVLIVPLWN